MLLCVLLLLTYCTLQPDCYSLANWQARGRKCEGEHLVAKLNGCQRYDKCYWCVCGWLTVTFEYTLTLTSLLCGYCEIWYGASGTQLLTGARLSATVLVACRGRELQFSGCIFSGFVLFSLCLKYWYSVMSPWAQVKCEEDSVFLLLVLLFKTAFWLYPHYLPFDKDTTALNMNLIFMAVYNVPPTLSLCNTIH
jgi:hypothetical protein